MSNVWRNTVFTSAAALAACGGGDKMPTNFENEIMPFEMQYPGMTEALKDSGYEEYATVKDGSTVIHFATIGDVPAEYRVIPDEYVETTALLREVAEADEDTELVVFGANGQPAGKLAVDLVQRSTERYVVSVDGSIILPDGQPVENWDVHNINITSLSGDPLATLLTSYTLFSPDDEKLGVSQRGMQTEACQAELDITPTNESELGFGAGMAARAAQEVVCNGLAGLLYAAANNLSYDEYVKREVNGYDDAGAMGVDQPGGYHLTFGFFDQEFFDAFTAGRHLGMDGHFNHLASPAAQPVVGPLPATPSNG